MVFESNKKYFFLQIIMNQYKITVEVFHGIWRNQMLNKLVTIGRKDV